jgi:ribose 5-phosphate isomerase A
LLLSQTQMSIEQEKRIAAEAAATLVESGMNIGLGTGSTVAFLLPAMARRKLSLRCVACSLGLHVEPFDQLTELDLVIDGADQMTPEGWLNKGRGAAHTREKILATAAKRFVIIADSTKAVSMLQSPVPVELLEFGLPATLRRLEPIQLRNVSRSPDGGVIADYYGPLTSPASVTAWLESHSGLIEHGLFPPGLVTEAFVGRGDSVQRIIFPNVRQ